MKKYLLLNLLILSAFFVNATNTGFLGTVLKNYSSGNLKGVLITDVIENSAAEKVGIKANDIVTQISGTQISATEEMLKLIASFNVNDEVVITYVRNGNSSSVKAKLGVKPEAKNYLFTKSIQSDGVHWTFEDDNTEIIFKDETPSLLIQKNKDGSNQKLNLSVPLASPEMADKLASLLSFKRQQLDCSCNCTAFNYTFYKLPKDADVSALKTDLIADKFTVAPNPTNGKITVNFSSPEKGTASLAIYDITGRIIQSDIIQNFTGEFSMQYNMEREARGVYFVQVKIGDKSTVQKIVLQ